MCAVATILVISQSIGVEGSGRCEGGFNIVDLGAVSGIDTYDQATKNGIVFAQAVTQANSSQTASQRTVLVPSGDFSFLPSVAEFSGVSGLTVCIEGSLRLFTTNFTTLYPTAPDGSKYSMIEFVRSSDLTVISETREGVMDGRGSEWWWYKLLLGGQRPVLLRTQGCKNIHLEGVTLHNAPSNHAYLADSINLNVEGVTVLVDLDEQLQIARYIAGLSPDDSSLSRSFVAHQLAKARDDPKAIDHSARRLPDRVVADFAWALGAWTGTGNETINPPFPMVYALNTDGIDFSGVNVSVTNCSITNFDDTVSIVRLRGVCWLVSPLVWLTRHLACLALLRVSCRRSASSPSILSPPSSEHRALRRSGSRTSA